MIEWPPVDLTQIKSRIGGRRVVSVSDTGDVLHLDDGTALELYMSDRDCCAEAQGTWVISADHLDAIITDVRHEYDRDRSGWDDGKYTWTNYATITILHNQNPVALAECKADGGNGSYYFSILSLRVKLPSGECSELEVLDSYLHEGEMRR